MRYLALLLLAGCVHGTPYEPQVCPYATVYVQVDTASRTLVTDSIVYRPECPQP